MCSEAKVKHKQVYLVVTWRTILLWIYFICLYNYSNLLWINLFYLLVHFVLNCFGVYYDMLSTFNKSAFGTVWENYHRNILKCDLILIFLLGATQWCNRILILTLSCKITAFLNLRLILYVLMSAILSLSCLVVGLHREVERVATFSFFFKKRKDRSHYTLIFPK